MPSWYGQGFQVGQPPDSRFFGRAAHFFRRLQAAAKCRTRRLAEQLAAQQFIQLDAWHTGRLAIGHARNGAGDGRRRAAGAALGTAIHRS